MCDHTRAYDCIAKVIKKVFCYCVFILIVVMSVATIVFVRNGYYGQGYSSKLETDSVKIGELNLVTFSPKGNEALIYDPATFIPASDFMAHVDSLNSMFHQNQVDLRNRQVELIADIRQETNNNLDKMSAWLAFWIAVLGFIGIACPVAYQFLNHKLMEKDVTAIQDKIKSQKKEIDTINDAYSTKMTAIAFTQLCESRLDEFDTEKMRTFYLRSIKDNFNKFLREISAESNGFDWIELKVHICSILINVHSFLTKFRERSSFEEGKRIKDTTDLIQNTIKEIVDAENLGKIKDDLDRIKDKLNMI